MLKYDSCVWNVKYLHSGRRLDSLLRPWTREFHDMSGMEYVNRLQSTSLYSINGRLLRFDLVMVWKSFHSDVDLSLDSLFEMTCDLSKRGHRL